MRSRQSTSHWNSESSASAGGGFQVSHHASRERPRGAESSLREGRDNDARDERAAVRGRDGVRRSDLDSTRRRDGEGSSFGATRELGSGGPPGRVRSPGSGPERESSKSFVRQGCMRPPVGVARSNTHDTGNMHRDGTGGHRGQECGRGGWKTRLAGHGGFQHGEMAKTPLKDWRTQTETGKRRPDRARVTPPMGAGRAASWSGKGPCRYMLSDREADSSKIKSVPSSGSRSSGHAGRIDEKKRNSSGNVYGSGGRRGVNEGRQREGINSFHSAGGHDDGRAFIGNNRTGADRRVKESHFRTGQTAAVGGGDIRSGPRSTRIGSGDYPRPTATSTSPTSGRTPRPVPSVTTGPIRPARARSHDRQLDQPRPSARSATFDAEGGARQGDGSRSTRSRSPPQRSARRFTPPHGGRFGKPFGGVDGRRGGSHDLLHRPGKNRAAWDPQNRHGVGSRRSNEGDTRGDAMRRTVPGGPKPKDRVEGLVRNNNGKGVERFGGRNSSDVRHTGGYRGNFPGGRGRGDWHTEK